VEISVTGKCEVEEMMCTGCKDNERVHVVIEDESRAVFLTM